MTCAALEPEEATPKTPSEWVTLTVQAAVVADALVRGVTEILHFTTIPKGMLGILASGFLKSRVRLAADDYLEHILTYNASNRSRDLPWHDYVNLSISRINGWLFQPSRRWHPDVSWATFSFSPTILGDPGVVFTTTNNAYQNECRRAEGLTGFQRLFDNKVIGYSGRVQSRYATMPSHYTTDPNAEVLYPGQLALTHLQRIYVLKEADTDEAHGLAAACGRGYPGVEIIWRPEAFK